MSPSGPTRRLAKTLWGVWAAVLFAVLVVAGQGPVSALHGLSHAWSARASAQADGHADGHTGCGGGCSAAPSRGEADTRLAGPASSPGERESDGPCAICIRLVLLRAEGHSTPAPEPVAVFVPARAMSESGRQRPAASPAALVEEARGPPAV